MNATTDALYDYVAKKGEYKVPSMKKCWLCKEEFDRHTFIDCPYCFNKDLTMTSKGRFFRERIEEKQKATYEERFLVAKEGVKDIVMAMNGLSEDGFRNRMMSDVYFRSGYEVIVKLFMEAKYGE